MVGAVRSILIPLRVSLAVFPARSPQVAVADRVVPSAVSVRLTVPATAPDSASEQLQLSVTSPSFQPFAFAAVRDSKATVGAVLSIFTPPWASLAVFPARSAQVAVADWSAPPVV